MRFLELQTRDAAVQLHEILFTATPFRILTHSQLNGHGG